MTLEAEIEELVRAETGVDISSVDGATPIAEIGVTSLDFMMLLFAIEEKFSIQVPESIDASLTLDQLTAFVRDHQQAAVG